ncbi:MAG: hypothetical protein IH609_05280 [Dehalococcoidia bacterium]|nr:hypothetical protein [Dehalococcoidia bacterium]
MGRKRHPEPLTPAEQRVLEEVRTGATNPEIAIRLGLSINTVKYHVANMLAKTGLDDRRELRQWCMPREGTSNWWLRGAVALGGLVVVVAAVVAIGLFVGDDGQRDIGVWVAYSPGPRTSTLPQRIIVRELISGEEHQLASQDGWLLHAPQWSPTGDHLLALESDSNGGPNRVVVFDRSNWRRSEAVTGAFSAAWSPDGQRIVAASSAGVALMDSGGAILAVHPDQVGGAPGVLPRYWSPGGSHVVVFRGSRTLVISRNGDVWTIDDLPSVGDLPLPSSPTIVGWSADGSFVLLAERSGQDTFKVDPDARTVERLGPIELKALLDTNQVDVPWSAGNDECILQSQPTAAALRPDRQMQWSGPTVEGTACVFTGSTASPTSTRPIVVAGTNLERPVSRTLDALDPQTMSVVVVGLSQEDE